MRLSISSLSSGGQAGGRTWRASGHPRALVWLRCARARAAARGALRQTARREPLERSSSSLVSSLAQSLTSSSQRLADFNGQSKQTPMLVALYALAHLAAACKSQPTRLRVDAFAAAAKTNPCSRFRRLLRLSSRQHSSGDGDGENPISSRVLAGQGSHANPQLRSLIRRKVEERRFSKSKKSSSSKRRRQLNWRLRAHSSGFA